LGKVLPALQPELESWVLEAAPGAIAYASSLLRDRGMAEDIVQDCFCRLLQKASVYNLPRDGRKLLFQAVTNACLNHNSRSRMILSLDAGRTEEDQPLAESVADRSALPAERILIHRELEQAVAEGLARLPVNLRAALELKSLGQSLQEIGEALGITANHAGVLVHRARQALAHHLAPYMEEMTG